MKKTIKKVLIIAAVIFVLLLTAGLIYYFPMFLMNPAETGHIAGINIYSVKDIGSNIYLLNTNNGYIMIDAGISLKKIEDSLIEAGINTNEVKWIFITHSDGDHLAALPLFPNANIYMSKDELPFLNGTMKRSFLGGNSMPSGISVDRIIPVSDRQKFQFNGTGIECILAQGHTNGSMLFLADDKYLFTGDAFKIKNGNMSVHPYSMDSDLGKKTMEQLKQIINSSHIILTSHYGLHHNFKMQ